MMFKRQSGVALFISLVLLLVLTIIGVSSVQTTSLEVRMTRNEHDSVLAFQAAESALRDAESRIESLVSIAGFTPGGNGGLYTVADIGDEENWRESGIWEGGNSIVAETEVAGVAEQPRYIIEHAASVLREENAYQLEDPYATATGDRIEVFRVTARASGGTAASQVILQSSYGRILN